jgi:hypothetical protein
MQDAVEAAQHSAGRTQQRRDQCAAEGNGECDTDSSLQEHNSVAAERNGQQPAVGLQPSDDHGVPDLDMRRMQATWFKAYAWPLTDEVRRAQMEQCMHGAFAVPDKGFKIGSLTSH